MMKNLALPIIVSVMLLAGCASSSAPSGWLANPTDVQQEAFGGWVSVHHQTADTTTSGRGELIAVHPDTLYVLTEWGVLTAFPRPAIVEVRLARYDADEGWLALWTSLGMASTLSHGLLLPLSASAWFLTGTIATVARSHQPFVTAYPDKSWAVLRRYARFPQGLPSELDTEKLRAKGESVEPRQRNR